MCPVLDDCCNNILECLQGGACKVKNYDNIYIIFK